MNISSSQKDRIYFLVKDPHWTLLWWVLSQETVQQLTTYHGGKLGHLVLRIYDVTLILFDGKNAHSWFDVEVHSDTDHWYLYIGASNRNYLAEIGYYSAEEQFIACARSHSIYMPREHTCDTIAYDTLTIFL